jgi:hypothetical protein
MFFRISKVGNAPFLNVLANDAKGDDEVEVATTSDGGDGGDDGWLSGCCCCRLGDDGNRDIEVINCLLKTDLGEAGGGGVPRRGDESMIEAAC